MTKRVVRIFTAWNDQKEEEWLSRMAREGFHLQRFFFPVYTFTKGEPADVVYRLDYRPTLKLDRSEYLGLFKDAGWEHVFEFANWHCFRTRARDGRTPEIFTDQTSRIGKYRRLLIVLVVVALPNLQFLLTRASRAMDGHQGAWWDFYACIRFLNLVAVILLAYAIVRIALKIRALKRAQGLPPLKRAP